MTTGTAGAAGTAGATWTARTTGSAGTAGTAGTATVGPLLRRWREQRRLSQLELSNRAEISTRHISFVETGRSAPSRDMVLLLAEELDVPLRERNRLLLAAGFAPVHAETALGAGPLEPVRAAIRQVLTGHEPYPAVVVDRHWNLVDANSSLALFTRLVAPHLLEPPANVLRATLHPDGMARHIVNLGAWRAHLLGRLARQVELSGGDDEAALLAELRGYPGADDARASAPWTAAGEIAVPLRLRHEGRELAFITTVATFGTPLDVTVAELSIESFYPADAATADVLRSSAGPSAG
jgi:transcriptional regulator with XRE-family HTH domain